MDGTVLAAKKNHPPSSNEKREKREKIRVERENTVILPLNEPKKKSAWRPLNALKKKTPLLFPGTSDDGRREAFVEQSRRVNGKSIPSKMEMTQSQ